MGPRRIDPPAILVTRWRRENDFDDLVNSSASANGVDPLLVKAIIAQESGFNPTVPGYDGKSVGLMQVTPATAQSVGITGSQLDPANSIEAGCRYLREMIDQFGQDGGISAYNGGPRPWLGYGKPLSTGSFANQSYVDHVKQYWAYFQSLTPAGTTVTVPNLSSASMSENIKAAIIVLIVLAGIAISFIVRPH